MTIENLETIKDLENFLVGNQPALFSVLGDKKARYTFIQKSLVTFRYMTCSKKNKGVVIQYLMKMTGYSRQQMTRLIKQYAKTGQVRWKPCTRNGFKKKYDSEDIMRLAKMDALHNTPCGAVMKALMVRASEVFKDTNYKNLAQLSISHLYNLRSSRAYKNQRQHFTKTQARQVNIGERRKPQSNGKPGYIRIDTVHQGDEDKKKGVYHINAVCEVTQFEVVATVEKISEQYLIPVLEQMLEDFPFTILGFHSDNGSEYINGQVAKLLGKLFIEFTKSRSRHSNDNALAESKNASVVRKVFGYIHIPQIWAPIMNVFNQKTLNPYLNYHKPCHFPEIIIDKKGKQKKSYPYKNMMTPYEKFKSMDQAENYLKEGISFKKLDEIASAMSDNEAAEILNREREKLFQMIFNKKSLA